MKNYFIEKDDKIVLFDTNKETLQNTLEFMPDYAELEIQETEREIIQLDNEFVFADEHQEEIERKEKDEKIEELKLKLDELDLKTVRPLRAINSGTSTDYDIEKLNAIELEAEEIRKQISELQQVTQRSE
jgi:hypothetical protein